MTHALERPAPTSAPAPARHAARWRPPRTTARPHIDFWGQRARGARHLGRAARASSLVSLVVSGLEPRHRLRGRRRLGRAGRRRSPIDDAAAASSRTTGIDADDAKIQERTSDSGRRHQGPGRRPAGRGRASRCRTAFAEAAGVDADEVSVNSVSSIVGTEITEQGDPRARRLPRPRRALHLDPLRVADGARRARRHAPRRRSSASASTRCSASRSRRRRSIAFLTILGYSLYDTHRRVRQGPRERAARSPAAGLPYGDVDQRLDEPGADALAQHDASPSVAAGAVAADRRRRASSAQVDAARVRHRPARRPAHRRLLVDLRRLAAARRSSRHATPTYAGDAGPATHRRRDARAARRRRVAGGSADAAAPAPSTSAGDGVDRRRRRRRRTPWPARRPPADAPAAAAQEEAPLTARRARRCTAPAVLRRLR